MNNEASKSTFSGDLSRLELDTEYRSTSNAVENFYKKCLRNSISYQRAVGYFRSSVLLIIGTTLLEFARRGGQIQIICSPSLSTNDVRSIATGYARRNEVIAASIIDEFDLLLAEPSTEFAARALATLIAAGSLEIRLAELKTGNGIYHEKIGLFSDGLGNTVSFRGSTNETWNGWHAEGNFEAIEVFCDWNGGSDQIRVNKHRSHFETLWLGRDKGVMVTPFPESAEKYIRKYSAKSIEDIMESTPVSTTSRRTPLPHQINALEAWSKNGHRGIFEHATGTGKTFTAIVAIREHVELGKPALVLVPSRLLLHQWADEISDEIPDAAIMLAGDGHNRWKLPGRLKSMTVGDPDLGPRITIAMMPTAATDLFLSEISAGNELLVVADEVHQLGSPVNSRALKIAAGHRLGLSATPRRYNDPDGTKILFDYFGGVVPPAISLEDAMKAGRLVPYRYFPHTISLNADESDQWLEFSNRIKKEVARSKIDKDGKKHLSERAKMLLIQRSRIAKKAVAKVALAADILEREFHEGQSWLVYCEDSEQLGDVVSALRQKGLETIEYHSNMLGDRESTMDWFHKFGGILVSIKCLDEGVDIPKVSHALILASSQNPRQFIQRRGRVLRTHSGKNMAEIHDAIVRPVSSEEEPEQMGLLKGELLRAIEFANGAINKSAGAELRSIAMEMGIDIDDLVLRDGEETDD
ncbi:DEAD/DEAH box helicase family protein [Ruegeria arenilitoris]|uniref:DEAD/DEAH box helicase family protein n=1 Tax=Ruegeria arenilitoris TaxID=1173585 RepID=UPI00147FA8B8|nr:DEAD/DEAH box helicase family protein [Ruegeria arenilitoris]